MDKIKELQHLARKLICMGIDGGPVYADCFSKLNKEVLSLSDSLFLERGNTPEEEASICLAVLMGYNATIYNSYRDEKKQLVLNRSWKVLDKLSSSLLKCELLTYCYGEVFDEELAKEAHYIINTWEGRALSRQEQDVVENLRNLEENQYPSSEVE